MSGILGTLCSSNSSAGLAGIRQGLEALRHRGPTRNQIVPIGNFGQVITSDHEHTFAVLAACSWAHPSEPSKELVLQSPQNQFLLLDADILNWRELRLEWASLVPDGPRASNERLLLAAFLKDASNCLRKIVGGLSLAIVDFPGQRLYLARDHLGVKPLYYSTECVFSFASQIGALLAMDTTTRQLNAELLHAYLSKGWIDQNESTLLRGIRQVQPGHFLSFSLKHPEESVGTRYWQFQPRPDGHMTRASAADELRTLVVDSVRLSLGNSEPAAMMLSGGIDTSSILGAARRVLGPQAPIHTLTFVADNKGQKYPWDEEPWADVAGKSTGATQYKVSLSAERIPAEFEKVLFQLDLPFASPVLFAHHELFAVAKELGFSTLMGGHGPEFLFAGADDHFTARIAALVRSGHWLGAGRLFRTARSSSLRVSGRALALRSLPLRWQEKIQCSRSAYALPRWAKLEWFRDKGVDARRWRGAESLSAVTEHFLHSFPVPAALRYEDRNSSPHGIRNRMPLLVPALLDFAERVPDECLVGHDGFLKPLYRRAMRGLVAPAILERRDRTGFPVPAADWLWELRPWIKERLASLRLPFMDRTLLLKELDQFSPSAASAWSVSLSIWQAVILHGWAERFGITG